MSLNSVERIEQRLARLEKEVQDLKSVLGRHQAVPWWEEIVGEFKGDKMFAEIANQGRKIRRASRKGAH